MDDDLVARTRGAIDRPLDELDRRILTAMARDGSRSMRQLASDLGQHPATVTRRVQRLRKEGTVTGVHAAIDPERAGWSLTALIGLRIEKGHLLEVQRSIAKDRRVHAVYDITGDWDGLVFARLVDRTDLDDLTKTTMSHEHIVRTNTMVVLDTVSELGYVPCSWER